MGTMTSLRGVAYLITGGTPVFGFDSRYAVIGPVSYTHLMDPEQIVDAWSSYMGLEKPVPYQDQNPLMEATPCFKK